MCDCMQQEASTFRNTLFIQPFKSTCSWNYPSLVPDKQTDRGGGLACKRHKGAWQTKDKYPHMMGSNPAQGITVVKCHFHPSLLLIKAIHPMQTFHHPLLCPDYPSYPAYPDIRLCLLYWVTNTNTQVILQLDCPTPARHHTPSILPSFLHHLLYHPLSLY